VVKDKPADTAARELAISCHLAAGDNSAAKIVAEDYVAAAPGDPRAYWFLAKVLSAGGDPALAMSSLEEGWTIDPGNSEVGNAIAVLAANGGDLETSRKYLAAVLDKNPGDLGASLRLAALQERAGEVREATATLENAHAQHPEAIAPKVILARYFLSEGDADGALRVLGDADTSSAGKVPGVLKLMARAQLAKRLTVEARQSTEQLLRLAPDDADANYLHAVALGQEGRFSEARRYLARSLSESPDHYLARLGAARLAVAEGRVDDALEHVEVVERINPSSDDVARLRAEIAKASGDKQSAINLFESIFASQDSLGSLRSLVELHAASGDNVAAIDLLEGWLERNPDDRTERYRLASLYKRVGMHSKAQEQYQTILEAGSDEFVAMNNLAWLLKDSDPTTALRYARKAHAVAGDRPSVLDTLAMALVASGEVEEALRVSERSVDMAPMDPAIGYHRALVLESSGAVLPAIDQLRKLLARETDFSDRSAAEEMLERLEQQDVKRATTE
jgi:putative PEP-CTERM system TPR-repeat lipoprotein